MLVSHGWSYKILVNNDQQNPTRNNDEPWPTIHRSFTYIIFSHIFKESWGSKLQPLRNLQVDSSVHDGSPQKNVNRKQQFGGTQFIAHQKPWDSAQNGHHTRLILALVPWRRGIKSAGKQLSWLAAIIDNQQNTAKTDNHQNWQKIWINNNRQHLGSETTAVRSPVVPRKDNIFAARLANQETFAQPEQ